MKELVRYLGLILLILWWGAMIWGLYAFGWWTL